MKKVLILGVNGFIGHHLSKRILETTDWHVYGMDMMTDRITDILNGRRSITADTAVRLGRYFGSIAFPGQVGTGWPKETRHLKLAQFWLDLQSQYDIAVVEREKGGEIAKRVRPADAA